ncbi:rod shape-determining protein MreC [Candidatus Dojkabacteria bacterium]|nr:rod shape-determining protein MreC [Candidatus Dojkabacteria bacterium]
MKERKARNNNIFVTLIVLIGISIASLLLDQLGVLDGVKSASESLQSGYRVVIKKRVDKFEEIFEIIGDLNNLKTERDKYQSQVEDLNTEVVDLQAEIRELEVYKTQLEVSFAPSYKLVPAQIIRISSEESGVFYINKGTNNGLEKGDVVVYKAYALGEIIEISSRSAKVRSIFSKDTKISAISTSGVKGVLVSEQGVRLKVEKILSNEVLTIGDKFMTLGINSNYPADLYLGQVKEISEFPSQTTKEVILETEINPFNLREVFVLDYED